MARILQESSKLGILTLDTAEGYGESQRVLGSVLEELKLSKSFKILTKFKMQDPLGRTLRAQLLSALEELRRPYVDVYSFHGPLEFLSFEAWDKLRALRDEGLARQLGVSVYLPSEALAALRNPHIDFVQIPFNVLDHRGRWSEVFKLSQDLNKKIHARSVFMQGLLYLTPKEISERHPHLSAGLNPAFSDLWDWSQALDLTLPQYSLLYVAKQQALSGYVLGVENWSQLETHLRFLKNGPERFEQVKEADIEKLEVKNALALNPALWAELKRTWQQGGGV